MVARTISIPYEKPREPNEHQMVSIHDSPQGLMHAVHKASQKKSLPGGRKLEKIDLRVVVNARASSGHAGGEATITHPPQLYLDFTTGASQPRGSRSNAGSRAAIKSLLNGACLNLTLSTHGGTQNTESLILKRPENLAVVVHFDGYKQFRDDICEKDICDGKDCTEVLCNLRGSGIMSERYDLAEKMMRRA